MISKMTAFNEQFNELVKVILSETQKDQTDDDENIQLMDQPAKSQDSRYTTTRSKSRNFLPNIAYVGINKEDYYNDNFI